MAKGWSIFCLLVVFCVVGGFIIVVVCGGFFVCLFVCLGFVFLLHFLLFISEISEVFQKYTLFLNFFLPVFTPWILVTNCLYCINI